MFFRLNLIFFYHWHYKAPLVLVSDTVLCNVTVSATNHLHPFNPSSGFLPHHRSHSRSCKDLLAHKTHWNNLLVYLKLSILTMWPIHLTLYALTKFIYSLLSLQHSIPYLSSSFRYHLIILDHISVTAPVFQRSVCFLNSNFVRVQASNLFVVTGLLTVL